jgi:hypothetical protein
MRYLKKFNENLEKTFSVPSDFKILIEDIGPNPTVNDVISCWNDCIEDNPIRYYHEGSNKFILEDGESTPEDVFICLNDYLMGDDVYEGIRIQSSVQRPDVETKRLSDETLNRFKDEMKRSSEMYSQKVDPYFLQEISDRLYGPDSEAYVEAIKQLNMKFRGREGRTGHDIFK